MLTLNKKWKLFTEKNKQSDRWDGRVQNKQSTCSSADWMSHEIQSIIGLAIVLFNQNIVNILYVDKQHTTRRE